MYVQRVGGVIVGAFANPQPGYATEFISDASTIIIVPKQQMPDLTPTLNTLMGFALTNSPAQNRLALISAIPLTLQPGRRILIPDGVYTLDPEITFINGQANNEIGGSASCYAYEPNPTSACLTLKFTAGTNAFDLGAISPPGFGAGSYNKFSNMALDGQNLCGSAIKSNGLTIIESVNISNFVEGIWLNELTNSTIIDRVSCNKNTNRGLLVGSGLPTFNDNTLFNISRSSFRQNLFGIRIEQGIAYSIYDTVIESNNSVGLDLFRINTGTGHNQNQGGYFCRLWLENNGAAVDNKPQLNIASSAGSMNVYDNNNGHVFQGGGITCYKASTWTSGNPVFKPLINIDCGHNILFDNVALQSADPLNDGPQRAIITLGQNTSNIKFKGCPGNFKINDFNNGSTGSGII